MALLFAFLSPIYAVGCSAVRDIENDRAKASASASLHHTVPKGVPVCELMVSEDLEVLAGYEIEKFFYDHSPAIDGSDTFPTFYCTVNFRAEAVSRVASVNYRGGSVRMVNGVENLDDARKAEGAKDVNIEGVEGEGVIYSYSEGKEVILVWKYPDGHYLWIVTTDYVIDGAEEPEPKDRVDFTEKLLTRIVSEVPKVAAGPEQEIVYYPPQPLETATPLTPWPSEPSSSQTR
ncbi:hypothetical protein [Actinomyces slackii]|nr:hypothetical protein [Actinomyces slackii]